MRLVKHEDHRGKLTKLVLEDSDFIPAEIFWISGVPESTSRGGHAHIECCQEIILVSGVVGVSLENSLESTYRVLENPGESIQIPQMTWSEQTFLQPGTEIVVLSSQKYKEKDYIRNKDEYRRLAQEKRF
jgi:hypothetical protein